MKNLRHNIDLNAPGGLEKLFAANRALFGDATMVADGEPNPDGADPKPTETPDASKPSTTDDDKLGESGLKALKAEREAAAKEKARADAAELRLKEIEDKDLSEAEKAKRDAEELRQNTTNLSLENARLRAIVKHSIPADYQEFVSGTDDATFEASAVKVAALAARATGGTPPPEPVHEQGTGGTGGDKSGGSLAAGVELYNSKHKK